MANERRVRADAVGGALSSALAIAGTTLNSAGLSTLPVIDTTNHALLTLFQSDANGRVTKREVVKVTAHTAAATSATIVRAQAGTTDQAWVINDRWAHSPLARDFPETYRKLADQTVAATALADITDLSFPIEANEIVSFELYLFFLAAATTTGLALGISGPATPTNLLVAAEIPTSTTALLFGGVSAYGTVLTGATTPSTTVPTIAKLFGTVENGVNAGTVAMRFAGDAAANLTAKRGSYLVVRR